MSFTSSRFTPEPLRCAQRDSKAFPTAKSLGAADWLRCGEVHMATSVRIRSRQIGDRQSKRAVDSMPWTLLPSDSTRTGSRTRWWATWPRLRRRPAAMHPPSLLAIFDLPLARCRASAQLNPGVGTPCRAYGNSPAGSCWARIMSRRSCCSAVHECTTASESLARPTKLMTLTGARHCSTAPSTPRTASLRSESVSVGTGAPYTLSRCGVERPPTASGFGDACVA